MEVKEGEKEWEMTLENVCAFSFRSMQIVRRSSAMHEMKEGLVSCGRNKIQLQGILRTFHQSSICEEPNGKSFALLHLQRSAKEWSLGCVNSRAEAGSRNLGPSFHETPYYLFSTYPEFELNLGDQFSCEF